MRFSRNIDKTLALIVSFLCLSFMLVACNAQGGLIGGVAGSEQQSDTAQSEIPETEFSTVEIAYPEHAVPALPESVVQDNSWAVGLYVATEDVEGLDCTGIQVVKDAYFTYLESVSAQVGKDIVRHEESAKDAIRNVNLAAASGSRENIICVLPLAYAADVYTSGHFYDVNTLPYLNLDQSYWNADFCEEMQVGGALYALSGALTPDTAANVACYVFNRDKTAALGVDVYGTVRSGNWTFEELNTLSRVYEDTNKNGWADQDDTLGIVYDANSRASHLFYGSGMKAYADGSVNPAFSDEDCSAALAKLTDWFTGSPELFDAAAAFTAGNAVMYATSLTDAAGADFAERLGAEIGIVPCPKYAAQVGSYASPVSMKAAMVAVSESTNAEVAGYCLEVMAVMADMTLTPMMQDCLYNQLPSDGDCREMIKLLCDCAEFDLDDAMMYLQNINPISQAVQNHSTEVNFAARKNNTQKQLDMIYSRTESANK